MAESLHSDSQSPLPFSDVSSSLHPEEQIALRTLPENEIASWTLAQVEVLQKRIHNLHRVHNAALPIHRLPNELLMRIFVYAFDSREDVWAAYVCSHWHAVLFATLEFWANALSNARLLRLHPLSSDDSFLRMALARSEPLPIKLDIADAAPSAMDVLAPHHRRIVGFTMDLEGPGYKQWDNDDLRLPTTLRCMQNLRSLTLLGSSDTRPLTWGEGDTLPALRRLEIASRFLSSSLVASPLTSLCILLDSDMNWTRFAEILSKCAALCDLSLVTRRLFLFGRIVHLLLHDDHPGQTVHLPKLRKITVDDIVMLGETLKLLRSPPPIAIVIETHRRDDMASLKDAIPLEFPGFYSPPFIDHISIVEDNPPDSDRCTVSGNVNGQTRFQAKMYRHNAHDILGLISPFTQNPELRTLTIGMGSHVYWGDSRYEPPKDAMSTWLLCLCILSFTRLELLRASSHEVKIAFANCFLERWVRRGQGGQEDGGAVVQVPPNLALAWELPSEPAEAAGDLSDLKKILWDAMQEGGNVRIHRLEIYGLPDSKNPPLQDGLDEISTGVEGETVSSLLSDIREMVDELVVLDSGIEPSIPTR
ncbi:hypothetical protein C8Q74DRAFT_8432 [Fomes fomentarius]|nr:hypothetical protein C8Q74DRAFT_8432 [Fomes fomentarius]